MVKLIFSEDERGHKLNNMKKKKKKSQKEASKLSEQFVSVLQYK